MRQLKRACKLSPGDTEHGDLALDRALKVLLFAHTKHCCRPPSANSLWAHARASSALLGKFPEEFLQEIFESAHLDAILTLTHHQDDLNLQKADLWQQKNKDEVEKLMKLTGGSISSLNDFEEMLKELKKERHCPSGRKHCAADEGETANIKHTQPVPGGMTVLASKAMPKEKFRDFVSRFRDQMNKFDAHVKSTAKSVRSTAESVKGLEGEMDLELGFLETLRMTDNQDAHINFTHSDELGLALLFAGLTEQGVFSLLTREERESEWDNCILTDCCSCPLTSQVHFCNCGPLCQSRKSQTEKLFTSPFSPCCWCPRSVSMVEVLPLMKHLITLRRTARRRTGRRTSKFHSIPGCMDICLNLKKDVAAAATAKVRILRGGPKVRILMGGPKVRILMWGPATNVPFLTRKKTQFMRRNAQATTTIFFSAFFSTHI